MPSFSLLVAVYFVNNYIFQNYQIPSSSLEKSLLVGDFLYVSKVSYGPQSTQYAPVDASFGSAYVAHIELEKSYIEWPPMVIQRGERFRQSETMILWYLTFLPEIPLHWTTSKQISTRWLIRKARHVPGQCKHGQYLFQRAIHDLWSVLCCRT